MGIPPDTSKLMAPVPGVQAGVMELTVAKSSDGAPTVTTVVFLSQVIVPGPLATTVTLYCVIPELAGIPKVSAPGSVNVPFPFAKVMVVFIGVFTEPKKVSPDAPSS